MGKIQAIKGKGRRTRRHSRLRLSRGGKRVKWDQLLNDSYLTAFVRGSARMVVTRRCSLDAIKANRG